MHCFSFIWISAFEFMDHASMKSVIDNTQLKNPLTVDFPFYVLIETSGSNSQHDNEVLLNIYFT